MTKVFTKITDRMTAISGHPVSAILAVLVILVWFIGAFFITGGFGNNTYQLLINTGTTCINFVLVFIIQASQNRDSKAINAKLDSILKDTDYLSDELIGIEDLSEKEITKRSPKNQMQTQLSRTLLDG